MVFRGAEATGATATPTPAKAAATKSAPRTAASGPVATEAAVAARSTGGPAVRGA
ncbi:hypothetical protein AB0877_19800 [Micromonospora sp. NPDC047644]|uniref:hypothetical protein n=1 Tax=Micromonospora sp. NPDC047644 TaxID=3157203 RepID=UPI0034527A0C